MLDRLRRWWSERTPYEFPVIVIEGPEGSYDGGFPHDVSEEQFLDGASRLLGEDVRQP